MNRAWHEAHPVPKDANLQKRIAWHIAHARECGCRDPKFDTTEAWTKPDADGQTP